MKQSKRTYIREMQRITERCDINYNGWKWFVCKEMSKVVLDEKIEVCFVYKCFYNIPGR